MQTVTHKAVCCTEGRILERISNPLAFRLIICTITFLFIQINKFYSNMCMTYLCGCRFSVRHAGACPVWYSCPMCQSGGRRWVTLWRAPSLPCCRMYPHSALSSSLLLPRLTTHSCQTRWEHSVHTAEPTYSDLPAGLAHVFKWLQIAVDTLPNMWARRVLTWCLFYTVLEVKAWFKGLLPFSYPRKH